MAMSLDFDGGLKLGGSLSEQAWPLIAKNFVAKETMQVNAYI
jgi:hypothetical protein